MGTVAIEFPDFYQKTLNMGRKKQNHILLYILICISIVIWSRVVFQIKKHFQRGSDSNPNPDKIISKEINTLERIDLDSVFVQQVQQIKNPFLPPSPGKYNSIKKTRSSDNSPAQNFSIHYLGFINDGLGSMAIIEFSPHTICIGKEGEIFEGFQIIKITKESVILKGDTHRIILPFIRKDD